MRGANCFGETQRLSFGLARPRIGLSVCAANEGDFSLFLQQREQIGESSVSVSAAAALFFRIVFHQRKIDICTHSWCVCVSRWLSRTASGEAPRDDGTANSHTSTSASAPLSRKRAGFDLSAAACLRSS